MDAIQKPLEEIIEFNPRETIRKGTSATKISMEDLQPLQRKVRKHQTVPYTSGSKFRNDDTIMARITPCLENGKTAQVDLLGQDEIGFGSTEFIVARAREGNDPNYVYYLLRSPDVRDKAIKSMVGTSGRQRVQIDVLRNILVKAPSLGVQQQIGNILRSFDDKIELNEQINENLLAQADTLFLSMFPYLPCDTLPSGWKHGTLSEIVEIHDAKRIPLSGQTRAAMTEKKYPYYGAASLVDYVDDFIFDGTFLLLGEDGTVVDADGYPSLQYVWGKFWVNNHAHILTGRPPHSTEYLWLLLRQTSVNHLVTGAVQPKINQANLRALEVVLPPKETLESFNERVSPLFAKMREISSENNALSSLRDTLLPRLMSGEIDVSEVAV